MTEARIAVVPADVTAVLLMDSETVYR